MFYAIETLHIRASKYVLRHWNTYEQVNMFYAIETLHIRAGKYVLCHENTSHKSR